jgi:glutaredoxin-like YruB-family protein
MKRVPGLCAFGIVFAITICCNLTWADIYKWVDDKGVVHFSDQPPNPKEERGRIESMPSAPPSTWQPPAEKKAESDAVAEPTPSAPPPTKAVKAVRPARVELYVTSWCKYCKQARNYLTANNIPFTEYDIEKDSQAAQRRKELDPRSGVPLAVINGKTVLGFSEASYSQALKPGR